MNKKYEINMTEGSLWGKMIKFALPLMLSSVLQLLFNAADLIVIGRFSGNDSLSAVGCTGSLVNLIVNFLLGLSVGCSVAMSQYYGAKEDKHIFETVHTSIAIATVGGIVFGIFGFFVCRPLLELMATPADVISKSTLYMRIYFVGLPGMMLYNFGASLLRAVGDTKRPLNYLTLAGVVNVVLNLILVVVFHLDVAGVAIATAVSQALSAVLVIRCLMKYDGPMHLDLRKLKLYRDKVIKIARVGIPSGLQGSVFAISNVIIQSSVNSFGKAAIAGNTAAANIDGFIYVSMNAFHQAALSFTGQNYGARKYKRISYVVRVAMVYVITVGLLLGLFAFIAREPLLGIYISENEENATDVMAAGRDRLLIMGFSYFLCGIMEVLVGALRGLGCSFIPMVASIVGVCGVRIGWIFTVFTVYRALSSLYISYTVSWAITIAVDTVCFIFVYKKIMKRAKEDEVSPLPVGG